MLGYPQLFPESAREQNCAKIIQRTIPGKGKVGFSHREQDYLRQATSEANQLIAARVKGVATFVPVGGWFAGHEICGSADDDWISGPTITLRGEGLFKCNDQCFHPNDQCFHPNEKGHKGGYAAAVNETLSRGPTPGLARIGSGAGWTVRVASDGSVRLPRPRITCPPGPPACSVGTAARAPLPRAARGRRSAATKRVRIGGSRFWVLAGRRKTIRFKLTRKGFRALKRRRRLKTTVKILAVHGSPKTTKTVTVTLKASDWRR